MGNNIKTEEVKFIWEDYYSKLKLTTRYNSRTEYIAWFKLMSNKNKFLFKSIDFLNTSVKTDKISILDFGCGKLDLSIYEWLNPLLNKYNQKFDIVGVDISNSAIITNNKIKNLIENKYITISFVNGDVQLCNLNRKFNVVISSEVIEHLPSPDKYLKNIFSHMDDNSFLVITTPNKDSLFTKVYRLMPFFIRKNIFKNIEKIRIAQSKLDSTHISVMSYAELKSLLEKNGFEVIAKKRGSLFYKLNKADSSDFLFWLILTLDFLLPNFSFLSWHMTVLAKKKI